MKQFLENADGELEAEIECACGGKLKYQRRRTATIWSVFGKVVYKRAYYSGCACQKGCAPVDRHYGLEAGKVTAGLARLIALSGIKESFVEGRKWLKEYLLLEVSENTIRSETQKMGELQRQADQALVKEMQDEKSLQQRERNQPAAPDILYGSIDAAKVRIEPRDPLGSGIIESGCKQIVTQRLKLPGAQWNLDGAILTAKARTAWMSGEWQKLVSARSLLPLAT